MMGTFVLVPTGKAVATIPGYASEDACDAAGRTALMRGLPKDSSVGPLVLGHVCVPGPDAVKQAGR
jgi:hypothetical protein